MRIGLNMEGADSDSNKQAEGRALEHTILNAQKGDWESKDRLVNQFTPLLTSLAQKRSSDIAVINQYVEAGKSGIIAAANKYKPTVGPDKFRIFALDFIEAGMDRVDKKGGLLARLFGKK